jgi:protein-tyrosine phosphatase
LLHFDSGVEFIKNAVSKEESILVHCNAGVSRSASFVIAYYIKEHGMGYEEALAYVKSKRKSIWPNLGFQK